MNEIIEEEGLYFLGISTTMGVAFLANMLNKFLDIELAFYTNIIGKQKGNIQDQMAVFSNFTPKDIIADSINSAINLEDVIIDNTHYRHENKVSKFMLVQVKGEQMNLFPKIKQLDYLFIANFPMKNHKMRIQSIDGIQYIFNMEEIHLRSKYSYFQDLFR